MIFLLFFFFLRGKGLKASDVRVRQGSFLGGQAETKKRKKYGCYHRLTGISHIHVLKTLIGVNLERECTGTGHQFYL